MIDPGFNFHGPVPNLIVTRCLLTQTVPMAIARRDDLPQLQFHLDMIPTGEFQFYSLGYLPFFNRKHVISQPLFRDALRDFTEGNLKEKWNAASRVADEVIDWNDPESFGSGQTTVELLIFMEFDEIFYVEQEGRLLLGSRERLPIMHSARFETTMQHRSGLAGHRIEGWKLSDIDDQLTTGIFHFLGHSRPRQ